MDEYERKGKINRHYISNVIFYGGGYFGNDPLFVKPTVMQT